MAIVLPRNVSKEFFAEDGFQDINRCTSFPNLSKSFRSDRRLQEQDGSIARVLSGPAGCMRSYRLLRDNDGFLV